MKINLKLVFGVLGALLLLFCVTQTVKINNNGYRTVVQWPTGETFVKFTPGPYFAFFGKTITYPDVITYDIGGITTDKEAAEGIIHGISVRYQDGGLGTVDGIVRVNLPDDETTMLELHRAFREPEGLNNKLLEPEVRQALNLTAGLMTSEEAYAERRNDFANWGTDQIQFGRFKTTLEKKTITGIDGSTQDKRVPVPVKDSEGNFLHQESPFTDYGMKVSGFQVTDWSFEDKTLDQISTKRDAEMRAITLEAQARQALAEKTQITAQGQAEVERIRYQELQVAEKATIAANREKDVAIINAQKVKETNAELLEAAKIDVQTAAEEKKATQLRADGEAYAKKAVIEADGALQQKLQAAVDINQVWADAYAKRQVPSFVMGGSGNGVGSDTDAATFQSMLNALIAKDLMVDKSVSK